MIFASVIRNLLLNVDALNLCQPRLTSFERCSDGHYHTVLFHFEKHSHEYLGFAFNILSSNVGRLALAPSLIECAALCIVGRSYQDAVHGNSSNCCLMCANRM
jgi:hypothetical protein